MKERKQKKKLKACDDGTAAIDESLLEQLADRTREAYIRERVRVLQLRDKRIKNYNPGQWWDGGPGWQGEKRVVRSSTWLNAAKWYLRHNLNCEETVAMAFEMHHPNVISPNQIYGKSILKYAEDLRDYKQAMIKTVFKLQQTVAKSALFMNREMGMNDKQAWRQMLRNRAIDLSALFRYCLAVDAGHLDIAEEYRDDAVAQYLSNPAVYDREWQGWIPQKFSRAAADWRDAVARTRSI